jgi:DNA-directed RNA polymerase subunit RPC12/RpoP
MKAKQSEGKTSQYVLRNGSFVEYKCMTCGMALFIALDSFQPDEPKPESPRTVRWQGD